MAENTGDNFSYVILPVELYSDIPLNRQPETLVRSMVRSCQLISALHLINTTSTDHFKLINGMGG